jgi:hypothetical protein
LWDAAPRGGRASSAELVCALLRKKQKGQRHAKRGDPFFLHHPLALGGREDRLRVQITMSCFRRRCPSRRLRPPTRTGLLRPTTRAAIRAAKRVRSFGSVARPTPLPLTTTTKKNRLSRHRYHCHSTTTLGAHRLLQVPGLRMSRAPPTGSPGRARTSRMFSPTTTPRGLSFSCVFASRRQPRRKLQSSRGSLATKSATSMTLRLSCVQDLGLLLESTRPSCTIPETLRYQ